MNLLEAFNKVFDTLYIEYIFSTILLIWMSIKYILPNDLKEWKMKIFSAILAICTGTLFYFIGDYKISYLIYSGLTLVTFYEWFAKFIFKVFGMEYKKTDPELIKPKPKDPEPSVKEQINNISRFKK
jgi:Ca2+/Na+ antiporter